MYIFTYKKDKGDNLGHFGKDIKNGQQIKSLTDFFQMTEYNEAKIDDAGIMALINQSSKMKVEQIIETTFEAPKQIEVVKTNEEIKPEIKIEETPVRVSTIKRRPGPRKN